VRVSGEEAQRYDDATTFFGDVQLQSDVRSATECESLCTSSGQCAAWTLDKYKQICMLRLLNVSTVRYAADFIGGRLTAAQLARAADHRRCAERIEESGLQRHQLSSESSVFGNPTQQPWSPRRTRGSVRRRLRS